MNQDNQKPPFQGAKVTIPEHQPVLYAGAVYMDVSDFGVVFNFAQQVGPTNQQIVVSRVGMSTDHAKVLINKLNKLLEKKEGTSETKKFESK